MPIAFFRTVLLAACLVRILTPVCVHGGPLNVVFILADDLGWSDLGCYGADLHETPHLDQLAREGVRFTQAYAMSVCSPSRASILTGRHAARLHMTIWREGSLEAPKDQPLIPARSVPDLPHKEQTIAEVLKQAGYLTFHVGKWHLGDASFYPETQGFDVNIGGTHWGAPATYFYPFKGAFGTEAEFRYVPGLGPGKPGDYLTDRLTDEALMLIQRAGDNPFFLNLWFHNPHTPIDGKPDLVGQLEKKVKSSLHHQNPGYAAMIHTLDENVGRVLACLKDRGLAQNTVVIFASDNGGTIGRNRGKQVTDNFPLRSGKGSLYEGGIRVPVIVRLPGTAVAGATCDEPILCMDFFPTILDLCSLSAQAGRTIDGLSLVPLLKDPQARLQRDALFFHYPHYYPTTTPVSGIRARAWKLLEYFEDNRLELYNLREDPGEKNNLASANPQRAEELRNQLHSWWREAQVEFPRENPAYRKPAAERK